MKNFKTNRGDDFVLDVRVEINEPENKITIRDNACGIGEADYSRAFESSEVPPDNSGLSEFGIGDIYRSMTDLVY